MLGILDQNPWSNEGFFKWGLDKMDSGKWFKKWNGKNYNARRK
jgi:hypothetical protein